MTKELNSKELIISMMVDKRVLFRYYFDLKLIIKFNGLGCNLIRAYNIVSHCIYINLFFQNNYQSSRGRAPIPRVFIASAERTGSSIFQKELDFTRNRLVDLLGDKSSGFNSFKLLDKFSSEYPIPVRKNIDFIRELP